MDRRTGEKLTQNSRPKQAKQNLQDGCDDSNRQRRLIRGGIASSTEVVDTSESNDDQSRAGPLIVSSLLLMNVVSIDPMMAVKMPAIGG